jgi:hypothetical protein
MGIIINLDNTMERMQPGEKITFGSLNFIADQFGDFHLQEPKLPIEEEQPPPICAFFARLEEVVDVGPYALTQHLNHYGHNILAKLGQENDPEAVDDGYLP